MTNNICTWNNCLNQALQQINISVENYQPKETKQDYKTLEYCGTLSNIIYCCFEKPTQPFDIYTNVNDIQTCVGKLGLDGKVTLGCLKHCKKSIKNYEWSRSMSKIISDDLGCCDSFVAYEEPTSYSGSIDYKYYNKNCKCATDIRGCPIYNPSCIVTKTFSSGCCVENSCTIETSITTQYVTEQFFNIFTNNIAAPLSWCQACCVNDYLGYEDQDYPNSVYNSKCDDATVLEVKSSRLCRQYCCVRCYDGLYGKVCYPYREYCLDTLLTEARLNDLPTPNGSFDGYCYLRCVDNVDIFNMCCWDKDGCRKVTNRYYLRCLNSFQPTFQVKDCSLCITRWNCKNDWDGTKMGNHTLIEGNPNSYYFLDTPIQITSSDNDFKDGMVSYSCKCYKKYLSKLKELNVYSTEKNCCLDLYSTIKGCSVGCVTKNVKWGMCRALILYCVTQKITEPEVDLSNCCVDIKEYYR